MKKSEKFLMWLAWKLPRQLVYFSTIRVWSAATTGQYSDTEAPAVTVDEALARWEKHGTHDT